MDKHLESRLLKRDIKPTAMRLLVLRFLEKQETAISLTDIEAALFKADKSTLFRTLKTFEKNRLIHSIEDGSGQTKYALCAETCECTIKDLHCHFHCEKCKKTYCLTSQNIPSVQLPPKFRMQEASLIIKGLCAACG